MHFALLILRSHVKTWDVSAQEKEGIHIIMIRLVVFDIDGVLTDGTILVDSAGKERKRISLRDLDAIEVLRQANIRISAITGEDTDITQYFKKRIPWDLFMAGRKDKAAALCDTMKQMGVAPEETLYIGDGKHDADALNVAGFGVCPSDACTAAKQASSYILHSPGGACVEELCQVIEEINAEQEASLAFLQDRVCEHIGSFQNFLENKDLGTRIMALCRRTVQTIRGGNKLLLCGNGGSAADAQHIAAEFVGRFFLERRAFPAEALTTNTSILTCLGNDYSYDIVFARQVEAMAVPGDLVIGLSTSGKSPNVLEALRTAKRIGAYTAMLMGDFACPEERLIDNLVCVPSKLTPRIQEMHIFIGHVVAEFAEKYLIKNVRGEQ